MKVKVRNKPVFDVYAVPMLYLTSPDSEVYGLKEGCVTTKNGYINEGTLTPVINHLNRYGYINEQCELVVPCIYKWADDFGCGLAEVYNDNGESGYINENGNVVIPFRWKPRRENYYSRFVDDRAVVCDGDKFGIIDTKGNYVTPLQWSEIRRYSEGIVLVRNFDGLVGYLDMGGNVISACQWIGGENFQEGLGVVHDGECYGAIDKNGQLVIPFDKRRVIMWPFSEGMAMVCIRFPGEKFIEGKLGGVSMECDFKAGYINKQGKMVIAPQYADALPFCGGLAGVRPFNGKYGIINKKGELVVPYKWKHISWATRHDMLSCSVRYRGKDVHADYFYDKEGRLIEKISEEIRVKKGHDFVFEEHLIKQSVVEPTK